MFLGANDNMEVCVQAKELCAMIAKYFGDISQIDKAIEELEELKEELIEYTVPSANRTKTGAAVINEMADVYIMLEQIKRLLMISDCEIEHKINEKLKRTLTRIVGGYYDNENVSD